LTQKLNVPEIIGNYTSSLKGYIRQRVNSVEDAEDVLQEVFFQLAETDRLMKPIDQIAAWLYTVARNRIVDFYRKKKTTSLPEYYSDDYDEATIDEMQSLLFDNGSTPETEYLRSLVWIELEKALSELPLNQREVFEMNELQGISFKEISEKTGEPVNTLISRKRYAVLYLRERLLDLHDELLNY
jgi:RNA polymerase sigma factor (sigma-70 family)